MSDMSIQPANVSQPKKNYVKKGALIGIGVQAGYTAIKTGVGIKALGKDTYVSVINSMGKGKYAALLAGSIALSGLIGAGIGKIVEVCKNKKAQKAE